MTLRSSNELDESNGLLNRYITGAYHCGPGNLVLTGPAESAFDQICRDHDISPEYGSFLAYFLYNGADEKMIQELAFLNGERRTAGVAIADWFFRFKRTIGINMGLTMDPIQQPIAWNNMSNTNENILSAVADAAMESTPPTHIVKKARVEGGNVATVLSPDERPSAGSSGTGKNGPKRALFKEDMPVQEAQYDHFTANRVNPASVMWTMQQLINKAVKRKKPLKKRSYRRKRYTSYRRNSYYGRRRYYKRY